VLFDLYKRLNVILTSVVTFATALAVAVNELTAAVAPELPSGWQDNALRIGGLVVAVLGAAVTAIRKVTQVPAEQRGLLRRQ
jgi:hypothetical protein